MNVLFLLKFYRFSFLNKLFTNKVFKAFLLYYNLKLASLVIYSANI